MIIVCPLSAVQTLVSAHRVNRVVSLLGPDTPHRGFDGIAPAQHLKLTFHDVIEQTPGFVPPRFEDVERMVSFIEAWDRSGPLLIHCWAGISRSTAGAFIASCLFDRDRSEHDLAMALREASPSATPNRLMVSHADRLLGRKGRMVAAIERIGRGADSFEGSPFSLSAGLVPTL